MSLINRYMIRNFGVSFFPIFMALFVIASVIYFINIATNTALLKVTFLEVFTLYLYRVPEILLLTLPISFFAGAVMALSKLSFDLEMIVFFALQGRKRDVVKALGIIALLSTLILLLVGLWLKPVTYIKTKEMIYNKQDTAQLNIKASEYGQQFGDWLLYVGESESDQHFRSLVLFNKRLDSDIFIRAKSADVLQKEGLFNLSLNDGDVYHISKESKNIEQIRFNTMAVNEQAKSSELYYSNIIDFWLFWVFEKKDARELAFALLGALFPIASLLMIVSIGIINPRNQKNRASLYVTLLIGLYYGLTSSMVQNYQLLAVPIVLGGWLLFSYFFYYIRIRNTY
jgi:lipopolysaccharide export system permease protein